MEEASRGERRTPAKGRGDHRRFRRPLVLTAVALLAGCAAHVVPPTSPSVVAAPARPAPTQPATPPVPAPANAVAAGVSSGPAIGALGPDNAAAALAAFRASCPSLLRRPDPSGLTRPDDWRPACDAAAQADPADAAGFFRRSFETVQVGTGRTFATGYFVPEIAGSLQQGGAYQSPIYARPDDLIDVDLGQFSPQLTGRHVRGRVQGTTLVPYYERREIEAGALGGHARVLAWAADPVAFFFLQVQGSGVLRLPDGSALRIGYASENGRDYTGVGVLMRERGLLGPNQLSMQGIVGWLHDHPADAPAILDENKSFVFFRPLAGEVVGALGLPVVGGVTAAADPRFVPLGAPVLLATDRPEASRLWVAQDVGGAIKGANRLDTFWGQGEAAARVAGGMSARGTALLLLPVGTLERLNAAGAQAAGDGAPAAR